MIRYASIGEGADETVRFGAVNQSIWFYFD
jgi:hypothetical protein